MKSVIYHLVGFDRKTERLAIKFDVPARSVRTALKIAGIEDKRVIGDWPLTNEQAHAIADVIGQSIDTAKFEFSLEPSAQTSLRRRARA